MVMQSIYGDFGDGLIDHWAYIHYPFNYYTCRMCWSRFCHHDSVEAQKNAVFISFPVETSPGCRSMRFRRPPCRSSKGLGLRRTSGIWCPKIACTKNSGNFSILINLPIWTSKSGPFWWSNYPIQKISWRFSRQNWLRPILGLRTDRSLGRARLPSSKLWSRKSWAWTRWCKMVIPPCMKFLHFWLCG